MQMPNCSHGFPKTLFVLAIIGLTFWWTQYQGFEWGTLQLASPSTITVTGTADGSQLNQKASFNATVTAENVDKTVAVKELTEKTNSLIEQIKNFGIEAKDIKTQNLSVYEYEEPIYTQEIDMMYPGRPTKTEKKWRASNTVVVTITDISKASDFATLLMDSGATDVYGPNFQAGDTDGLERELLAKAMSNAEEKANLLLEGSKQKIRRVLQVSEGYMGSTYPIMYKSALPMAGGGMDLAESIGVEPGSQELSKTVTVIYEISR
ncbi:MAG: hypothetical protein AUK08_02640 [Candidatus Pacebacteria bacterium CG2_30_36_39]|nr:SIMPL domain-containing protein [Candidatus Pacearchaeota archaeon]OIP74127.1 MAG: hypothetical protein AUK08_02640 [Candidatus Pacebacteria bacterium CG2_30_36_39]